MQTVQYRRWAPSQSQLRIEFSPDLLQEIRRRGSNTDRTGVLYGMRHGREVRVMSAASDPQFDPIGTFASRLRGDVFLTESDLERFEQANAVIALVVAGGKGGFFVKNSDGSIQSVQSYEEFSIAEATSLLAIAPIKPVARSASRRRRRRRTKSWAWAAAACLAIVAIPLVAAPLLKPLLPRPRLGLSVLDDAGHLRITWNARAIRGHATLEIEDGGENTVRPVDPVQTSAVYSPRTQAIEVRLSEIDTNGAGRHETARFVGHRPRGPSQTITRILPA